jgi:hypothetical protein
MNLLQLAGLGEDVSRELLCGADAFLVPLIFNLVLHNNSENKHLQASFTVILAVVVFMQAVHQFSMASHVC